MSGLEEVGSGLGASLGRFASMSSAAWQTFKGSAAKAEDRVGHLHARTRPLALPNSANNKSSDHDGGCSSQTQHGWSLHRTSRAQLQASVESSA